MNRTSSRRTSNSDTSSVPRSRKKATSRSTSSSGALAPEEMPTTRAPSSHSSCTWSAPSIRYGGRAEVARDVDQPVGVRGVLGADHEHEVALLGHLAHGGLAVRGRVTDVVGARPGDVREALAQLGDDRPRLVDRERGLRDVGQLALVVDLELVRRPPRTRRARCGRAPRPSCPRPPRDRRGRSGRSCSPRRRTSAPRGGPWSPAGTSRRSCAAGGARRRRARPARRRGRRRP